MRGKKREKRVQVVTKDKHKGINRHSLTPFMSSSISLDFHKVEQIKVMGFQSVKNDIHENERVRKKLRERGKN